MATIPFKLSDAKALAATVELLIDNHALLNVILGNQIKDISEKTGEPPEEVLKRMNERFGYFRNAKAAEIFSKYAQ
jgi:hypothetical protein